MRRLVFILFFPLVVGCTGAVSDFVEGGGGSSPADPIPSVDMQGSNAFKLSPGHVKATSSVANMRATLTPTDRAMTSAVANAQMSLNASQTRAP